MLNNLVNPSLNPCICGKIPKFDMKPVPVFDEFDSPYQYTIRCNCGITFGPDGSNREELAKQWNKLMGGNNVR
jgi:hypothetical protein